MDNRLNIEVDRKFHYTLLSLEGRLDTLSSEYFSEVLQQELANRKHLVLDFSQCLYLSSSGIRALITTSRALGSKGGLLLLTCLPAEVFQVLEMAGLHDVIPCFPENSLAEKRITELEEKGTKHFDTLVEDIGYLVDVHQGIPLKALCWNSRDMAGYDELGIAVGIGSPGEKLQHDPGDNGLFVILGNCGALMPFNLLNPPDFRVVSEPQKGSIFIESACSFPAGYSFKFQPASARYIHTDKLLRHAGKVMESKDTFPVCAFLIASLDPHKPTLTFLLETDTGHDQTFPGTWYEQLSPILLRSGEKTFTGIRFMLNHISEIPKEDSLLRFINRNLTLQNIESIRVPELNSLDFNPIVWVFSAPELVNAESSRIKIEVPEGLQWESHKNYLVRNLYTDSARVVLHSLQGGYTAQTFQSESFDHHGRQLRPTVLKIADRDLISREAERCQKYSLPYIMNNSAMVLGTAFYLNRGALRYNFVGIGGGQSELKWLTHYFNSWPAEKLEPLFDKIFLNILKPWYGQPVREKIFPFRDHNPVLSFFPNLCEVAEAFFSLSADDKYMQTDKGKTVCNPYWFLKHEYPARAGQSLEYYKSVCHGDLNMQNILLDEQMNVYLIDFSETRPRSVVSDFARLEAIFMIERAPLKDERSLEQMERLAAEFYNAQQITRISEVKWTGEDAGVVAKNLAMIRKMRQYALMSASGDENILPYYVALLEWVLPVVCYQGVDSRYKKLSAYVAGLLCDRIMECDNLS